MSACWRATGQRVGVALFCFLVSSPAYAASSWQADWERTVEAAKKEGQVVVYIKAGYDGVFAAFQKSYPDIKVVSVPGQAADITNLRDCRRSSVAGITGPAGSGDSGQEATWIKPKHAVRTCEVYEAGFTCSYTKRPTDGRGQCRGRRRRRCSACKSRYDVLLRHGTARACQRSGRKNNNERTGFHSPG